MNAPNTTDELLHAAPQAIARRVGATPHITDVVVGGDLTQSCRFVLARFSPATGVVTVSHGIADRFTTFLHETSTARRRLVQDETAKRFELGLLRGAFETVVATMLRGMGPADPALMRSEWNTVWQFPHGHTLANGVAEALAARIAIPVAADLGLLEREPRLADVATLQSKYVAQAGMVDALATSVAAGRGTPVAAELSVLAREGGGQLALWALANRWSASPDLGDPAGLGGLHGMVELGRAISSGLTGVTLDWGRGDDGRLVGFDEDIELAATHHRAVGRALKSAVRRVLDGADQIDLGAFGRAIAAAAEMEDQATNDSMDSLQGIWDMMESGLDVAEA